MLRAAAFGIIHTRSGGDFLRRAAPVKPRRLALFRPGAVLLYCGNVRSPCMISQIPIIATRERTRYRGRVTEADPVNLRTARLSDAS